VRVAAFLVLCAVSGCAANYHAGTTQPPIVEPQQGELQELERQQVDRSEALNQAAASAECRDVCGHVEAICRLSDRICRIADRHRGHAAAASACQRSTQRCQAARKRVAERCPCSPSDRKKPSEL